MKPVGSPGPSGREPAPAGATLRKDHPARHAAAAAAGRHGALLTGLQRRGGTDVEHDTGSRTAQGSPLK